MEHTRPKEENQTRRTESSQISRANAKAANNTRLLRKEDIKQMRTKHTYLTTTQTHWTTTGPTIAKAEG